MWPFKNKKSVKSASNISVPLDIRSLITGQPFYTSLNNQSSLENEYISNPVLSSVIDLKASYSSNAVVSVRNIKNGEIITTKQFRQSKANDKIVRDMFKLINNPNPLQSTKEFLSLNSVFKDVFGNSFIYGNSASDSINIRDVKYLWAVWPQYMKPILTGKYFDATQADRIIEEWKFERNAKQRTFKTDEILHRKDSNIGFNKDTDLVLGQSKQTSLQWPLSNIRIAYESRNVIARERGARAIISPDKSDVMLGSVPMEDEEKEQVQNDFKRYGLREGQNQFVITNTPLKVHQIDQDIRKLGLIPEIAADGMAVAQRYGVPEVLVKLYMKGATFENQESSERRMYQNTTIPESNDNIEDLNVWLKTRDFGYEYIVSFDHIPVLQENEKDRSEISKNINIVYEKLFFGGAATYNQWIQALGIPAISDAWANKRITQMSEEEIFKIKGNFTMNSNTDENTD